MLKTSLLIDGVGVGVGVTELPPPKVVRGASFCPYQKDFLSLVST